MSAANQWLDVISQNLANVSTTGFKRDVIAFNEGLIREMRAQGGQGQALGLLGAGASAKGQYTIFDQGNLSTTGNALDLGLAQENGMFAVQTESGRFFTRDGAFTLNQDRQLTSIDGGLVLDDQGNPITLPAGKVIIASDGQISVDDQPVARLGIHEGQFSKVGSGLYSCPAPRLLDSDEVQVRQGVVESSNVNAVEEMIAMIRLNRAFEMAQKSVQSQDEATQRLIQSLQDR